MGRGSRRRELLQNMNKMCKLAIYQSVVELTCEDDDQDENEDDETDEDEDPNDILEIVEDLCLATLLVSSCRYLKPRQALEYPQSINEFLLYRLEESRFQQEFRMQRSSFNKLCNMIRFNPVFLNRSNNPQRPVEEQLMVTLKRLGCYGNGTSVGMLSRFFRIGEGTVELYTNRVLMAILSLQDSVVFWPNESMKTEIKDSFKQEGFENCIGLVDGTLFGLHDCPTVDGADFFSRKGHYGIASLVVCDHIRRITYLSTGWPGCSHDQRLMDNSCLTTKHFNYFNRDEYLLADSGFVPMKFVVPAYKRPAHGSLSTKQHRFNNYLAHSRVRKEHCIGLLKGRFQSLKSLRLRMAGKRDLIRAGAWIKACAILHNLLIQSNDLEDEAHWLRQGQEGPSEFTLANKVSNAMMPRSTVAGREKREQVQLNLFKFLDSSFDV